MRRRDLWNERPGLPAQTGGDRNIRWAASMTSARTFPAVVLLLAQASLFGAWMPPSDPGVRILPDVSGTWRIDSRSDGLNS